MGIFNLTLASSQTTHEQDHLLDPVFSDLASLICETCIPVGWSNQFIQVFYFIVSGPLAYTTPSPPSASRYWKAAPQKLFTTYSGIVSSLLIWTVLSLVHQLVCLILPMFLLAAWMLLPHFKVRSLFLSIIEKIPGLPSNYPN